MVTTRSLHVILLLATINLASSANILGVFTFPSKSHYILGHSLLKGLAKRGNNVTMLSPYKSDEVINNFNQIVLDVNLTTTAYGRIIHDKNWYTPVIINAYRAFNLIAEALYQDPTLQQLINSTDKYDVIIYSHMTHTSLFGLSHIFNASTVLFSVIGSNHLSAHVMNLPIPSSYVSNLYCPYSEQMTFLQRLHNLFINAIGDLYLTYVTGRVEEKLLVDNYPGAPSMEELIQNIQLVFLNSHVTLDTIKPIFQNMINIGGYYMDDRKELPGDVQQFLTESERGVIYFSFGSNIKYEHLPIDIVQKFVEAFAKLPFNVLWKLNKAPGNVSSNVKIVNWISQISVLAHPHVKMFITHGGKGSMNEAIYYGVPSLYFPFYADQQMNAKEGVAGEFALELDLNNFTVEDLIRSIKELILNPSYKEQVMQRSTLIRNQGVHPMDTAAYWVDYISKNPRSKFLEAHATKMPWYQVIMLDIFAFLLFLLTIVIICLYFVVCKVIAIIKLQSKLKTD